jgi:2-polyprenyl-3-methyl-5-hydroxy-6-metoxy-1,4-benzoquinol methylase
MVGRDRLEMIKEQILSEIKRIIPRQIKVFIGHVERMIIYHNYDSSSYWRNRASEPGQAAVLWQNEKYNLLYRKDQFAILEPWVESLPTNATVLDIGCGIGVVSRMIRSMRDDVVIHAVDFPEMIEVAKNDESNSGIVFIESAAEDFIGVGVYYDLIVSSACYSAIRDISKLLMSVNNGINLVKPGGIMVMIDPFHRWSYLARARLSSRDLIGVLGKRGMVLVKKSGVLFWPFRVWLANCTLGEAAVTDRYRIGEWLLKRLGGHFWADYKILIFRKPS